MFLWISLFFFDEGESALEEIDLGRCVIDRSIRLTRLFSVSVLRVCLDWSLSNRLVTRVSFGFAASSASSLTWTNIFLITYAGLDRSLSNRSIDFLMRVSFGFTASVRVCARLPGRTFLILILYNARARAGESCSRYRRGTRWR